MCNFIYLIVQENIEIILNLFINKRQKLSVLDKKRGGRLSEDKELSKGL